MYLWKCWRDARLAVAIFFVPIVMMVYSFLRHAPAQIMTGSNASAEWLLTRGLSIMGILLLFVAWSLGGDGIGHAIAEDRGAFLLTRPRLRRFFIWADSGCSFGLMAALAWGMTLLFVLLMLTHVIRFGPGMSVSPLAYLLIPLSGVVFAGLVYAVTYLCTVTIPLDKTARVVSVAVLICVFVSAREGVSHLGWGDALSFSKLVGGSVSVPIQLSSGAACVAGIGRTSDCDSGAAGDLAVGAGAAGDQSLGLAGVTSGFPTIA